MRATYVSALLLVLAALGQTQPVAAASGYPANPQFVTPSEPEGRYLVFISDLHMNVGKIDGQWHPYEDFRWPNALAGFLRELGRLGHGRTDLVILGDFLELWQNPDPNACASGHADAGCTVDEAVALTARVIQGHRETFQDLAAFSQRADNRLYIVPGNHDAALVLDEVWRPVAQALQVESGRVGWMRDGIWLSADGKVLGEHGHQMGSDVNRYPSWPEVLRRDETGAARLIRTWGEHFVARVFNQSEARFPLIDNFSPLVKGAWYVAVEQGFLQSANDIARFLAFDIFETSVTQKLARLGERDAGARWNETSARRLGYQLFAYALEDDHPARGRLLADEPEPATVILRAELDRLALDEGAVDRAMIETLCDRLRIYRAPKTCGHATQGAMAEGVLDLALGRIRVQKAHVEERRNTLRGFVRFVFGHTHAYETGHDIILDNRRKVRVWNSGAFQRLIDDRNFRRRLEDAYQSTDYASGMSRLTLERDLKPCYSAVMGEKRGGGYEFEVKIWLMEEGQETGELLDVLTERCDW